MPSNEDSSPITDSEVEFACVSDSFEVEHIIILALLQLNSGVLAFACTIPGTCVCFLVLLAFAITASSASARKQVDRCSIRNSIRSYSYDSRYWVRYWCIFCELLMSFSVELTLSFSTFFTTCIAINLQVVLVHGLNGTKLEKYYLIGTTMLSLALNVPTFALHQFGWDETSATCWYKNSDDKIRLRWIIGTQSFWIFLAATIETVCSFVVLFWMYRYNRRTTVMMKGALGKNSSPHERDLKVRNEILNTSEAIKHDPTYRRIILRISLYPIISLMMNYSTVALDLDMSIRGVNSQLDFRLLVLDLILYGVRTLAYGILAAIDPAFINALRAAKIFGRRKRRNEPQLNSGNVSTNLQFAVRTQSIPQQGGNMLESKPEESSADRSESTMINLESRISTSRFELEELREFGRQL
ncbi:hypothetical protein BDQ12DRAFT_716899 [Crucibulum laeve]|uniref:G-protein coupled receptors family 2 profile 2 domain-containing protein n=1 Tax=Crucibulum laeve TaxID=68775 RepID=A0A5C3LS62_9AGAR|nr:hypothetical protein BDQ12DRAFT_716899 [Crucibulum laeve]